MVHYHKPECLMEKWYCCVQGQGYSNFKILMNFCPDDTFLIAEPFTNKHGHIEGLHNQNMAF